MDIRVLDTPGVAKPMSHYSNGVVSGAKRIAAVAGQVGILPSGQVAGPDVFTQTKRAFESIRELLQTAGLSPANILKFTSFLVSADDISEFYAAREETFEEYYPDGVYPANSLLIVSALVRPDLRVEIEALAASD